MDKPGQLIRSFITTLLLLMAIGFFIRGYGFNEMPWQIYAPGAAFIALFNVYVLPWLKKKREERN